MSVQAAKQMPVEAHHTARWSEVTGKQAEQRTLARTVGAHHSQKLSRLDTERNLVDQAAASQLIAQIMRGK
ncbi:MAG: hypothetical protein OHK0015_07690 [Chloroflexi bacterium OHK40]